MGNIEVGSVIQLQDGRQAVVDGIRISAEYGDAVLISGIWVDMAQVALVVE